MIYNKYNFLIAKYFAPTKSARPEITGILITPNKTVATDSFRLAVITTPEVSPEDIPALPNKRIVKGFNPFILPKETAIEILKAIPKGGLLPIVENAFLTQVNKEMVEFTTTDLDKIRSVATRVIEGDYPNYKEVLSEQCKYDNITLNIAFLIEILQFSKQFSGKSYVTLRIPRDKKQPVRVNLENDLGQKATLLLMPVRDDDDE